MRAFFLVPFLFVMAAPAAGQTSGTVGVLPFTNITGVPADAWIGAGIAETLVADLQGTPGLTVVTRERLATALTDAGVVAGGAAGEGAVLDVGRRLGARWVISGGYQRLGDQIRITARLVEVATGAVVRTAKVDGALDDLFDLQDQLAGGLSGQPGEPASRMAARSVPPAPGPSAPPVASALAPESSPVPATTDDPRFAAGSVAFVPSTVAGGGAALLGMIDGPPPPIAPEVMNRDELGRTTIRAIKLDQGITVDGRLDERVYFDVPAVRDFIQQVPVEGATPTERTEAWVMFDGVNLYVSARCYESAPPSEWVANEMRRDSSNLRTNDNFGVLLDTFYDRRNGLLFYVNPIGGFADMQITNEGNPNRDWNPVWNVRTARFEGGWTVEMEIPFKSIRYQPGSTQIWGIQLRRTITRKNEWNYTTALPISAAGFGGSGGIFRVSGAGTLVGLEVPGAAKNLEVKPYYIGDTTTDLTKSPPRENDPSADFGVDAKYGITQNLTADFTYNTDFAQVEVDEQQVNLTRFSLFFPEKREFFLEGRGIFEFARGSFGGPGGGGGGGAFGGGSAPTLFYSRRIGLERGEVVPIIGGGRVTGKVGSFDLGALNIQTDAEEISGAVPTNFTVLRVKRDVFRRSSIGGLFTNRSVSLVGDGMNQVYGADATFSFYDNVNFLGYYAKTQTPGVTTEDESYQGQFSYNADRYGFQADHLLVGDNFIPEVGFVRRDNMRRSFVSGRFSPRPRSIDAVRQFTLIGSIDYILTAEESIVETRQNLVGFNTEFENSDTVNVTLTDNYEFLFEPFEPSPGFPVPAGGHSFSDVRVSYGLGPQRRVAGQVSLQTGGYFDGDITSLDFRRARIEVLPQFSIEPRISLNWIDLPSGSFTTELVSGRFTYTFNPRMFFSGLLQYNSASDSLSTNLRLRWEYIPGSELFVVYTEDLDTDPLRPNRTTELRNRGFVIKINRLFRF